ncbi:TetR/AcrR family transcriptional regulator [Mucilaginibacter sp. RS28]|uniref:TetR/AcrR family transcriptional regulator n=1 Tax=Mucilaginibacter straminoryzae TaxID=2932774 RepID=A0A9X1X4P7_9SPHI|nr:TetR/AcrR family transcriptional regulator [Mucilaginibacter straminoryzae]MCJ8209563.1 TetR/AcrR family transcriptional regulator [Mucilaginibacter straminoryzae]
MVEDKKTEQKIFEAALAVFHKKGLNGARMQEIADTAGINKAMLHYYYRSKEQLFGQVFLLSFRQFIGGIVTILNHEGSTWEEKIPMIIEHYASSLILNPNLPLFVINELRSNPEQYLGIVKENHIKETVFVKQLIEAIELKQIRGVRPLQIFITIVSGIVFPYLAEPLIKNIGVVPEMGWETFMEERKKMIHEMLIKYLKEF